MMKYLSLILLVGMASAQHCRKIDIDKSMRYLTTRPRVDSRECPYAARGFDSTGNPAVCHAWSPP